MASTQGSANLPASTPEKLVFSFAEGDGHDKKLLGGKGANLCEMTQIGLNVPPGFVISTAACLSYLNHADRQLPAGLMDEVLEQMRALEKATGKGFGDADHPLLVSVRSGSAMSMPGMMDTILNLGLNRETLNGLIRQTGNERFSYDAYRRFIQLFGKVALGLPDELFDKPFDAIKQRVGVKADVGLTAAHLKEISEAFLEVVLKHTGQPFPEDVFVQLEIAIKAVFNSWMGKRAVDYRREFHITPDMASGTAVNIVTMVFGNMGSDCATGVGFTRNPGTGENHMYGEYLVNAQGEDVVAGIRTPKPVQEMAREMPALYPQLVELRDKLESHYREVQDYEYTIEKGTLYCLQTRNAKMNAAAMVRTSVEMAAEGLITRDEALLRVEPELLEQLLHPRLDPKAEKHAAVQGLPASPGAASGKVVFDADRAELMGRAGEKVILVREETKPEDIHGFFAVAGHTHQPRRQDLACGRRGARHGQTLRCRRRGHSCQHAEPGRQDRRTCCCAKAMSSPSTAVTAMSTSAKSLRSNPSFPLELRTLLGWADEVAPLKVMTNVDTPETAARAVDYGAMGIGLCRTERMFNAPERLPVVVDMILANTEKRNARRRWTSCCRSSAPTSRRCSRSWRPARSPSGCWIRRYTNSCPASGSWNSSLPTCASCAVRRRACRTCWAACSPPPQAEQRA